MFYWANHDLLDSGELDRLERFLESPTAVPSSKGMTTEQLAWEKEKLQMQLKQQEMMLKQQESQRTHDLKQQGEQSTHELEMLKLKLDSEKSRPKNVGMFDPAKSLRLMPSFNEDSVEEFFRCFEKVALALKWSKELWIIMVQSALKGRAQKCLNLLPENEGHAELKRLVLREYELRPESNRLKFRKNRKLSDSETYVYYLRAKKLDLDKWLDFIDIKDEYLKLYDLILLEEFKHQLPSEVKVHLADKEIKDPYEASKTADNYSICHRLTRRTGVSESHFKMGENTWSQHHKNKDNGADDSSRTKEKREIL